MHNTLLMTPDLRELVAQLVTMAHLRKTVVSVCTEDKKTLTPRTADIGGAKLVLDNGELDYLSVEISRGDLYTTFDQRPITLAELELWWLPTQDRAMGHEASYIQCPLHMRPLIPHDEIFFRFDDVISGLPLELCLNEIKGIGGMSSSGSLLHLHDREDEKIFGIQAPSISYALRAANRLPRRGLSELNSLLSEHCNGQVNVAFDEFNNVVFTFHTLSVTEFS